ncbi:unnamed protein product [Symbiodinium natans]|uniref:Uncharacterized protein n=1 Tax=Symbiodinium natans TaxID=878477 RepID=A0A812U2Q7_9DINO|nr:unnamed protein product [Symbiodinium natans]
MEGIQVHADPAGLKGMCCYSLWPIAKDQVFFEEEPLSMSRVMMAEEPLGSLADRPLQARCVCWATFAMAWAQLRLSQDCGVKKVRTTSRSPEMARSETAF